MNQSIQFLRNYTSTCLVVCSIILLLIQFVLSLLASLDSNNRVTYKKSKVRTTTTMAVQYETQGLELASGINAAAQLETNPIAVMVNRLNFVALRFSHPPTPFVLLLLLFFSLFHSFRSCSCLLAWGYRFTHP